jgi:hypothetical protein
MLITRSLAAIETGLAPWRCLPWRYAHIPGNDSRRLHKTRGYKSFTSRRASYTAAWVLRAEMASPIRKS